MDLSGSVSGSPTLNLTSRFDKTVAVSRSLVSELQVAASVGGQEWQFEILETSPFLTVGGLVGDGDKVTFEVHLLPDQLTCLEDSACLFRNKGFVLVGATFGGRKIARQVEYNVVVQP